MPICKVTWDLLGSFPWEHRLEQVQLLLEELEEDLTCLHSMSNVRRERERERERDGMGYLSVCMPVLQSPLANKSVLHEWHGKYVQCSMKIEQMRG